MATTIVVGANRGIGLELARRFAARGDAVIAACRASSAELAALGVEVVDGVEVASDDGVSRLARHVAGRAIDLLVVAAGILRRVDLAHLDVESIRRQFEVNALGPLRVAHALLTSLHKGSKIAFLTSRMGSIGDNTSGSHYGYRMSKAALNMAGRSLALDLRPREIAVVLLHPGYVRTDMTGGTGEISAPDAAAQLVARIDELTLATSGELMHANGEQLPW